MAIATMHCDPETVSSLRGKLCGMPGSIYASSDCGRASIVR
jgi:hypothetical protein